MTPEEIKKITALLRQQAEYQKQVSESFEGYMNGLKELKGLQEERNHLLKVQLELTEELKTATGAAADKAQDELDIIEAQLVRLEKKTNALGGALAKVNKTTLLGAKGLAEGAKAIGKSFDLVQQGFNKIKSFGLFEMDKAMKMSALSMGILSKQTNSFNASIERAALRTNMIGFSLEDAAQAQAVYSEELGRTVMLGEEGLVAIGQIAKATGLGAEGAAKMAAEFENQGISAQRTATFMEDTMNNAHKLGLNASKVVKTIQNNMKMLNKYNFKGGTKGLEKMAELVTKLGVDMEFASGFADKLWNVEGAVEMSAQLQVMGGQWAQLADPFSLMYKARNDMEGLTEEIGNAAAASAKWNKETGEFDISAQEMHRLKIIADQTGLSYDELAKAGKNAAKFSKIKGQASFDFGSGPEGKALKEFVTNTSELDEQGRASITVGVTGEKKFLNQLTQADKKMLLAQIEEKATMAQRAKDATTFDEQVTFLINQIKVLALPLIKVMNEKLIPKLQALSDRLTAKGGLGEKIMYMAEKVGEFVSFVGGLMIDNPLITGMAYLATKAIPLVFDMIKWYKNGEYLALGFNKNAMLGMGPNSPWQPGQQGPQAGMMGQVAGGGVKGMGKNIMSALGSKQAIGGGLLAAATTALMEYNENAEKGMGTGENVARTAGKATGAGLGAWGGAAAGAAIGTLIFPGVGTAIGGLIGGGLGAWGGGEAAEGIGNMIVKPSVHDGIVSGGEITPFDNKDEVLMAKKGGAVQQAMNTNTSTKIEFGTLTINGTIMLQSPGSPGMGEDLLKNPEFKRDITAILQSELEKNKNFGKNRG